MARGNVGHAAGRGAGSRAALALALSLSCGGGALAQTPIPPAPQDFALAASQSDRYEVMAAQVALIESKDPRVRAFAETMVRDHARTAEDLRRAAVAAGLQPPPPSLSGDGAALLAALQGVRGHDFDRAYARQQVVAHAQAVAVEDSFAAAGTEPALRQAAQGALPIVRAHLTAAWQLMKEVDGG